MKNWYKSLTENNTNYKLFYRKDQSIFIHDDSYQLNTMEAHQNLYSSYILWIKTPIGMESDLEDEDTVWVPLIPGYSILTKKNKYARLSIGIKDDGELEYTFENFENDYTFTNSNETKHYNHMFNNFKDELGVPGKISIPSLLGFDNVENITYLRDQVLEKFPSVQEKETNPKILTAMKTNERTIKAMKRKGKEISDIAEEEIVQKGIHVQPDGVNMSPKSVQALMVSNNSHIIEKYKVNQQIKKIKGKLEDACSKLKDIEENTTNSPYLDNAENKKELVNVVNKIIEENNLGSTIFMSSENYLKLILSFPCKQCGCNNLSLKRWRVKAWGLYLNITIFCEQCQYIEDFTKVQICLGVQIMKRRNLKK